MPNERIDLKPGDQVYSAEPHLKETENFMSDMLNDYSHVISKNPQDFEEKYGKHLPKKDGEHQE